MSWTRSGSGSPTRWWGAVVIAAAGCSAPPPLRLEAPTASDRTTVVVTRSAAGTSVHAMDSAAPLELPVHEVDGQPVTFDVLGYTEPLESLGFAGAPGPLTVVAAPEGRRLFPWAHAHRRTATTDEEGAWAVLSEADGDLRVATEPACLDLRIRHLDIPPDTVFQTLYTSSDAAATLVVTRGEQVEWWRLADGARSSLEAPVPALVVRAGAVGPDGNEWVVGARGTAPAAVPELWMRPAGGTFARIADSPSMTAGRVPSWISATTGALWIMTAYGEIERYAAGTWVRRYQPDPPFDGERLQGSLAAVSADVADAVLPFVFSSNAPRPVVRIAAAGVTVVTPSEVLASSVAQVPALGGAVVGTQLGVLYGLGAADLLALETQPENSEVFSIIPLRHGPWEGALYNGLNGFLYQYYQGFGPCPTGALGYNASTLVAAGRGWFSIGYTRAAEGYAPRLAWITR